MEKNSNKSQSKYISNSSWIVFVVGIIISAVIYFISKGIDPANKYIYTSIAFTLTIVAFLVERIFNIMTLIHQLKHQLVEHNQVVHNRIEAIRYSIKPESLKKFMPDSNPLYIDLLNNVIDNSTENFDYMIGGRFNLSVDSFTKYWFDLLNNESIKFYYSSAIVIDEYYFIKNNIESLKMNYCDLSLKKDVKLRFFVANSINYDELINLKKDIDEFKIKNVSAKIDIKIGQLRPLELKKGVNLLQDIGIAGEIAYAVLDFNLKHENGNGSGNVDRYYIDFNKAEYEKITCVFNEQEEKLKQFPL